VRVTLAPAGERHCGGDLPHDAGEEDSVAEGGERRRGDVGRKRRQPLEQGEGADGHAVGEGGGGGGGGIPRWLF
jgi:hypothetical protein